MSKVTRELKKLATKAETAARFASDDLAANQLKALATAFRTQARVIKKNKKEIALWLRDAESSVLDLSIAEIPAATCCCIFGRWATVMLC